MQQISYRPIENFVFRDDEVTLTDHIKVLFVNDGSVIDLMTRQAVSDHPGIPTDLQTRLEESWSNLQTRAAEKLQTVSGVNHFYSGPVLACGVFDQVSGVVAVSTDLEYKTVTASRSNAELYDDLFSVQLHRNAYVVKSILVTADNKVVLGKRSFFGDWPSDRYECPGGFLGESDIVTNSICVSAINKITADYQHTGDLTVAPFALYEFDRILETIMLCVARTTAHSHELASDFYDELLLVDHTRAGVEQLLGMSHAAFHPPSRMSLKVYQQYAQLD